MRLKFFLCAGWFFIRGLVKLRAFRPFSNLSLMSCPFYFNIAAQIKEDLTLKDTAFPDNAPSIVEANLNNPIRTLVCNHRSNVVAAKNSFISCISRRGLVWGPDKGSDISKGFPRRHDVGA